MGINPEKSLYKQLEEMLAKIDELLLEINHLKKELSEERENNKKLIESNLELTNKLNQALEELDRERSKNNKNSGNSSKPSSTDIVSIKREKTGANLYNYRQPSKKKRGGQQGHQGTTYTKEKLEKDIKEKNLKVITVTHTIYGKEIQEPLVKYKIGLEINPIVYKHVFMYSSKSKESLPKEFQTDVTYDTSVKTMALNLDTLNVVSLDRQTDFFSAITDDFLHIGKGTLMNFKKEFSSKAQPTLVNIENNLHKDKTMYTDETITKKNGKQIYTRNYSNHENVLYKMHSHKGHEPIKEDGILTKFLGGIMGDHDTTLYKYGTKRYECNIHVGRYLQEIIELVPDIKWVHDMKTLLFKMKSTREIAIAFGSTNFTKEKVNEYNLEYDSILTNALVENKSIKSKTFRSKAEKLRNRLLKYKINHIYFIYDFEVPFDNNLSESDIRVFKIKTKVSGGFRSSDGAQYFADALSIIKTAKKRKMNPTKVIESIYNNHALFA